MIHMSKVANFSQIPLPDTREFAYVSAYKHFMCENKLIFVHNFQIH
jgi:hypothetical protein